MFGFIVLLRAVCSFYVNAETSLKVARNIQCHDFLKCLVFT
ncbi:hypothetical protein ApDm4_1590 [Acetobacter pomorum]|nr:hypothetical protein ApDm4_1590 [Acetobacter pomorum]